MSKRTYKKDGYTVIVERILDEDPDTSFLDHPERYSDEDPEDRERYMAQDAARLKAYHAGDWYFLGIVVTIRKQTATKWANGGLEVGRASVWGYESDSEESYLESEEENITAEAFAEVERLRAVLCSSGSK